MTSPSQEFLIVSRRNQPTELHLSDGTVAFLEPRGTLAIPASVRSSPQLLALERQHAVTVKPAEAPAQPAEPAQPAQPAASREAPASGGPQAEDAHGTHSRWKRSRTK